MAPTDDDKDDVFLACRYGDLSDVKEFISKFGAAPLIEIRDENENCVLHMICGNGHLDVLDYLLPFVPSSLLAAQNSAKSTPLHWAALNKHLAIVQKLIEYENGPGIDLIDIKNAAGHTPLGEAELAEWDEGATWLVKVMNLETQEAGGGDEEDVNDESVEALQDIEVEIQDADGQIAKMTISGGQSTRPEP